MISLDDPTVQTIRASGLFDESWYCRQYEDVKILRMDPVIHYIWLGCRLGRDPSPEFSTTSYLLNNPDVAASGINPFFHYVSTGRFENRPNPNPNQKTTSNSDLGNFRLVSEQRQFFSQPSNTRARAIAFHLPQFHRFPENDAWWGDGFTEWVNVKSAQAQFLGHYQPHIPHPDIGYYDLSTEGAFEKQIELAKSHGIYGFCFYYYWFGGKRLMERAIEQYLINTNLNYPFCLCWANENWSRRWDGLDSEILIAQAHSPDDDLACISDLARYIKDKRYIRVDGKPLVLIYRPSLLPSPRETALRWREWCRNNGIGEIYLAYTQSFEQGDATEFGFDAAIEFPPNNSSPPDVTANTPQLSTQFSGKVYDWEIFVKRSASYVQPSYKLFRSVCPGWDNTARRKTNGTCFVNNSPENYQTWLENALVDTEQRFDKTDERLVFINAWNEWAEGAHLEPDNKFGYAYLNATRNALTVADAPVSIKAQRQIVIVSHDAYRHGAQLLALNMARTLVEDFAYRVHMIVLGDGPLKPEFARWAELYDLSGKDASGPEAQNLLRNLYSNGARLIICNTTVSGSLVPTAKRSGFSVISLIHELPAVIKQYDLEPNAREIARHADRIIFPAEIVAQAFEDFTPIDPNKRQINPQGLYKKNLAGRSSEARAKSRARLRSRLRIPQEAPVILGVGYADRRKGFDLFVEAGVQLLKSRSDAYFVWVGAEAEAAWMDEAKAIAVSTGVIDRFILPGFELETDEYYAGADVFALTSREDPFPSVVLESMDCGLPVVGFSRTGGMSELIEECGGLVVEPFDSVAFAAALMRTLEDHQLRHRAAITGPETIDRRFRFRRYVHDLISFDDNPLPRVSVIVPNYNYARYITARLESIHQQTIPVYELIILDDHSDDDSVNLIRSLTHQYRIPTTINVNDVNSGSVFRQWQRGVGMARGDLIWIAEADDLAHPEFLSEVVPAFDDTEVVLSYCQSRQIDADGHVLCNHYLDYVADVDAQRWQRPYLATRLEEIQTALFLKNTIPNASAVVFRKSALQQVLSNHGDDIISYRNAGDWLAYIRLNELGAFAFNPKALNDHRRHTSSLTIGNGNQQHFDEIVRIQNATIQRFNLGEAARTKAKLYSEKIALQFNL